MIGTLKEVHTSAANRNSKMNLTSFAISLDTVELFVSVTTLSGEELINVYGDIPCPAGLKDRLIQARQGLSLGLAPRLALDGTGGTYFLRNAHKENVCVFKPSDEEPFAPNNPR